MSDTMSKCPEMIGYVGDVRNLSENRGVAISDEKIIQWVKRSNSAPFATVFYSTDDVYNVGRMQTKLLNINPDLKFKQISVINEFIDYVDTGMDRNEHPVKDIEMINVYSWWEIDVDYVEEARKRHEPEVYQISREALNTIAEAGKQAIEQKIKKTIINIFTGNKDEMTLGKATQQVKDEYMWDQASAVKDQIMNVSDIAKNGVDEMKDKRELMTKGIKGLPDVKPQTVIGKFANGGLKLLGPVTEVIDTNKKIEGVKKAQSNLEKSQKSYEQCMEDYGDFNSKHYGDMKRCINIQKNMILRFQSDIFKAADYEALDPSKIKVR